VIKKNLLAIIAAAALSGYNPELIEQPQERGYEINVYDSAGCGIYGLGSEIDTKYGIIQFGSVYKQDGLPADNHDMLKQPSKEEGNEIRLMYEKINDVAKGLQKYDEAIRNLKNAIDEEDKSQLMTGNISVPSTIFFSASRFPNYFTYYAVSDLDGDGLADLVQESSKPSESYYTDKNGVRHDFPRESWEIEFEFARQCHFTEGFREYCTVNNKIRMSDDMRKNATEALKQGLIFFNARISH